MFRTLRSRLTIMATGVTLVVSLFVCVTLYVGIRTALLSEVDAFLAGEVMEFRTILSSVNWELRDAASRLDAELGSRHRGDLAFRLLDANGDVLLTSGTTRKLQGLAALPSDRQAGFGFGTEYTTTTGDAIRTCSQWVPRPDGTRRIVQTHYLLDQVHASLGHFRLVCAAALGIATILAFVGGRIVATRGLRPVGAMATAARGISVENLKERLARSGAGDELDHLAETFNDMLARLERQVAQLQQFTADAAHELRTPMAALRGHAEVALSRERSAGELRSVLAEAIEDYDRLARIADDLLLLAKADAGQRFIVPKPFRFDRAVIDVVDLFAARAEERGVAMNQSECDETWVEGDDGRLRQMLGNLLDNAITFTPAGGRVCVTLTVAKGTAVLAVQDTGVGIAPEHLPRICDRFYRVDAARTRAQGGSGLGLSICRSIVEGHHGQLRIKSEPGHGTTVTARLPACSSPIASGAIAARGSGRQQ